jgi:hypothetical protein
VEGDELIDDREMEVEDNRRFRDGRNGDHLMVGFQCDECQFENCKLRSPMKGNVKDEVALLCIRRANLDTFWSRERSTANINRLEGMRYLSGCEECGWNEPYPARGAFALRDECGMKVACSLLSRSRDPGKNAKTVQYETIRKMRNHMSNFVHATPGGHGATFMSEDGNARSISNSPTNSAWFRRFMRGCHKRMGDVWIPDRPLTIRELKCMMELLEEDWELFANDLEGRRRMGLTSVTIVAGFLAALRGEEIVRIYIGNIHKYWGESLNYPEAPHVPLMLAGRFKREVGEKLFCQPMACKSASGIDIALWFHRTLEVMNTVGVTDGPLFRVKGKTSGSFKKVSMGDLDPSFLGILKRVQSRWPSVIPDTVKVEDEYSVFRSLRRGATSHAQNVKIPKEVIEANNRWRKRSRANSLTPGMSMMERYSDAKASVPALIRFLKEM